MAAVTSRPSAVRHDALLAPFALYPVCFAVARLTCDGEQVEVLRAWA
eukprot:COSAG02_NODE_1517_length_12181_cov_5.653038_6_plen_47_part_00